MKKTEGSAGRVPRRGVLKGMTALAGVSIAAGLPRIALAAGPADAEFMAASKALVGKHQLTPSYGKALLAAFRKAVPGFDGKIAALNALIGQDAATPEAVQAKLAADTTGLADFSKSILTGWYLGVAGSGDKAICVAYASDFANQEVADVLRPPSYA
ncbi:hypothetical protein FGG78_35760, partial [Thioclava sp. BHET1]